MQMSLFLFFFIYIVNNMELPQDIVKESTESVNPKDLSPSIPCPLKPDRGEHDVPIVSTKALLKIFLGYGKGLRSTHGPYSSN